MPILNCQDSMNNAQINSYRPIFFLIQVKKKCNSPKNVFLQILCLYCGIKYCSHTIDIRNLCSTYVYIVTTFCQITKTDLKTFKSLHRSRNGIGKTLQSFWKMMSRQRLARNQDLDKQRLIHMFILLHEVGWSSQNVIRSQAIIEFSNF